MLKTPKPHFALLKRTDRNAIPQEPLNSMISGDHLPSHDRDAHQVTLLLAPGGPTIAVGGPAPGSPGCFKEAAGPPGLLEMWSRNPHAGIHNSGSLRDGNVLPDRPDQTAGCPRLSR